MINAFAGAGVFHSLSSNLWIFLLENLWFAGGGGYRPTVSSQGYPLRVLVVATHFTVDFYLGPRTIQMRDQLERKLDGRDHESRTAAYAS